MLGSTFDIHACLGKGGFAEVYLATQRRSSGVVRTVAVKVLREEIDDMDVATSRLQDEAKMLGTLRHPAILGVLELTRIEGRLALVTEYVEGVDLSAFTTRDLLAPARVSIGVVGEVASALDCAWNTTSPETNAPLHLVHRDIKPENIRLSRFGEVKLLDFGVARTAQLARFANTGAGNMPFTPGYAAPESYARGEQSAASDVYALGVTLFRLLVGERLYEGVALPGQFTITSAPERYGPFLRERLARVAASTETIELLRDMLAYEASERPTALMMARRCDRMADELPGPTHICFARSRSNDGPKDVGGTLVGRTVSSDPLHTLHVSRHAGFQTQTPVIKPVRQRQPQPTPSQAPQALLIVMAAMAVSALFVAILAVGLSFLLG